MRSHRQATVLGMIRPFALQIRLASVVLVTMANVSAQAAQSTASSQPLPEPPPQRPLPTATIDDTLSVEGEAIAAREVRYRLMIPVHINDTGPFRFVVDTGADRSVVGIGLAQRLALPVAGTAIVHSVTGPERRGMVTIDALRIGSGVASAQIEGIRLPALSERDLGADGLIGIDMLGNQRVRFDFDANTITLDQPRKSRAADNKAEDGEIVVTARLRRGQLIMTQVKAGGAETQAVIDSGTEVTFGNMALRRKIFAGRREPDMQQVTMLSVTGQTVQAEAAVIPRIQIGTMTVENVVVAFADLPPFALFGLDKRPALLLGSDVMRAFSRVTLDFRAHKVRFVRRD